MQSALVPRDKKLLAVLALTMLLQAALVFSYALTRIYSFNSLAIDTGVYLQVLDAILATGIPTATLHPVTQGAFHWLGFHFTPLLYAIAPLYALAPGIPMLVGIHTAFLALAAIPLYAAAKKLGLSPNISCFVALLYLYNPLTLNAGIWGFQEPSLAVLPMAVCLWALAARRFAWLCAMALLLLLTKEHYGLTVIALGGMWWWCYRQRRGLALSGVGAAALLLVIFVLMPSLRGDSANPMFVAGGELDRFSWLLTPARWKDMVPYLFTADSKYIFTVLACFGFLSLGAPFWLFIGLADLSIILLASVDTFRFYNICYPLPLTPALALSAGLGYAKWQKRIHPRLLAMMAGIPILVTSVAISSLPLPYAKNYFEFSLPRFTLNKEDAGAIQGIKALLPEHAPVLVQPNVGTFFIEYPHQLVQDHYIVRRLQSPLAKSLFIRSIPGLKAYILGTHELLANPEYKIIYWQKPWVLFAKQGKDIPDARQEAIKALEALAEQQALLLQHVQIK